MKEVFKKMLMLAFVMQFNPTLAYKSAPDKMYVDGCKSGSSKYCSKMISQSKNLSGLNLKGASLDGQDLTRRNLSRTNLSNSYLWHTKFNKANLFKVNFMGANFKHTSFIGANLTGVIGIDKILDGISASNVAYLLGKSGFRDANNSCVGCYVQNGKLSGVNLSGKNLSGINLSGADLSGADLSGAILRRANLTNAKLKNARLIGSDLAYVKLSGADLNGVDFKKVYNFNISKSGANLSKKQDNEARSNYSHAGKKIISFFEGL